MRGRHIFLGLAVAVIGVVMYYCNQQVNPVTGEKQHISLSPQQEIAMGMAAAPVTLCAMLDGREVKLRLPARSYTPVRRPGISVSRTRASIENAPMVKMAASAQVP